MVLGMHGTRRRVPRVAGLLSDGGKPGTLMLLLATRRTRDMGIGSAQAVFAVVQASESFFEIWAPLAEAVGCRVRVCSPGELPAIGESHHLAGLVVSGGGAEEGLAGLVAEAREAGLTSEILVVGASTHHRLALATIHAGGSNYVALPAELPAVRSWFARQGEIARDLLGTHKRVAEQREQASFGRLIGQSEVLRDVIARTMRIIPVVDLPVLITGETGTGKELLAQAIHYQGSRAAGPFVEVNCAALPAALLESELFGVEKGAFTDAKTARQGLFESAHGGTLFLDEIGDMPLDLQGKILRAIEDKRIRRVGGVRVKEIDVRIVAATHVHLRERVREGRFRQDLFFRLSVVPLHLPPLRDRGNDVLDLANHFLALYSRQYHRAPPRMDGAFRVALLRYPWPGNVRELAHAINRAILLGGDVLEPSVLEFDAEVSPQIQEPSDRIQIPWPCTMNEVETAFAAAALKHAGGNKVRAAELLDISRNRLRRLLQGEPSRLSE